MEAKPSFNVTPDLPLVAVALLIDELKNEDPSVRLNSFQKLENIAKALGEVRTRNELLPFLSNFPGDEEEEVLITLAQKLCYPFVHFVGGIEHVESMLSLLKQLASVDETSVNDHAVNSITSIIENCNVRPLPSVLLSTVESLAAAAQLAPKRSACPLIPALVPKVSDAEQTKFLVLFVELCRHDSPIVRRAACTNLGPLVRSLPPQVAFITLTPPFQLLSSDSHDSVRLHAVPLCIEFGRIMDNASRESFLFPIVRNLCRDDCWRVRYMAADKFRELCDVLEGVPESIGVMVDCYVGLLQDGEAEVRTAASSRVFEVSKLFGSDVIVSRIVPAVTLLASDPSQFVRGSLATNVMGLCSLLDAQSATDLLVPMFSKLLKDEFPEVRLNIISKLDAVGNIIGLDQLSRSLMPAVIDLACDRKWRIRLTVILRIPQLARELGVELFEQRLSEICMAWMVDEVYAVREAATKNLTELIRVFGPEWAISHVAPKIKDLTTNTNYLHRMTALYTTSDFAENIRSAALTEHMLPIVLPMSTDPVPNIRFNVAKTLEVILRTEVLQPSVVRSSIEPVLAILLKDPDQDVKYFAQRATRYMTGEHKSIT